MVLNILRISNAAREDLMDWVVEGMTMVLVSFRSRKKNLGNSKKIICLGLSFFILGSMIIAGQL